MAAPFGAAIYYLNLKSGSKLFTLHFSLFRALDQQRPSKMLVAFGPNYNLGPAATSALPASLPSYFLKFLMKRAARSLAFSSH